MSQISDILKIFPLKSRTYENGYKNYSANCFCKFKGLQLTFQVVNGFEILAHPSSSLLSSSGRQRCRADIEYPAAESDIERVSAEQIGRIHEHEKDRGFPPLCGADRWGLPNTTTRTTASGTRDAIPSTTPMNRSLAAGNANGIEISW
jgi:hypothetical protein